MRLGTYEFEGKQFVGIVENNNVYALQELVAHIPEAGQLSDMLSVIRKGKKAMEWIQNGIDMNRKNIKPIPLGRTKVLAPIVKPQKNVFCVGRNYIEHVDEGDRANGVKIGAPKKPIFFSKTPTTVIGHDQDVVYPGCTEKLDYECELAVIIGKDCKNVSKEEAYDCIFGYSILNDVTARDLQDAHTQWFLGKSLDTFCPIGPYIVTKEELSWPLNVAMELTVNGEVRQSMVATDMLFDVPTIIAELSKGMTLEAGDIIATGTGPGCGFGFNPPKFLKAGDTVEITIEQIGTLRNKVIQ
jgi:2-keto-4-pentenoate hydratase/2-oxohepta-3-ene-1,7-dioic acid hydratase in catechol pathway